MKINEVGLSSRVMALCYLCDKIKNKQERGGWMTTLAQNSDYTILLLFFRNKSFRPIANEFKLNYNAITTLLGLYLFTITHNTKGARITPLHDFITYYSGDQLHRYLNSLIDCSLVLCENRVYSLTQRGLDTIKFITNRADQLVYSFCSNYDIEL
jgi:hypothetical protein